MLCPNKQCSIVVIGGMPELTHCPSCKTELVNTPPKAGTTPSTGQWTSLTSPVDSILNTFLLGLGYEFKVSQNRSNEVWQEARNALQALITQERNKAYQEGYDKARNVYSNSKPDTYGIG